MKKLLFPLVAAAAAFSLSACNGSGGGISPVNGPFTPPVSPQYTQIERLSRPAIKEVFETFVEHQTSNAAEPYNDSTIKNDIMGTEDALRPPTASTDYGAVLQSILYPDEYTVNLNGTSPTSSNNDPEFFLSNEVDGAGYFGGRSPNDDVINLELPVLFGKTLFALGVIKTDDHEENDCISTQNTTTRPSQMTTTTFPYLAAAH